MWYDNILYKKIYDIIQKHVIWYNMIYNKIIWHSFMWYNILYNTILYNIELYNTIVYITQYYIILNNIVCYNIIWYNIMWDNNIKNKKITHYTLSWYKYLTLHKGTSLSSPLINRCRCIIHASLAKIGQVIKSLRSWTKTFIRSKHQRRVYSIRSLRIHVGELKCMTLLKLHIFSGS